MTNDYVASFGTVRTILSDLGIGEDGVEEPRDGVDFLYTVFLDDPSIVPGGATRFASGALLQKGDGGTKSRLLEVNKSIPQDVHGTQSKDTRYEVAKLPKVTAAMAQHPFTDGAWSALLMRYKVCFGDWYPFNFLALKCRCDSTHHIFFRLDRPCIQGTCKTIPNN